VVDDALQTSAGRKDVVATTQVTSSEPGSRYIDFLIPGLLGMNLMNSGMWGIGFALVDMRQRKLLKRYVGTPMRRGDFLLALLSSRLLLMLIEIGLLLALGVIVFHMKVLASIFEIVLLGAIGAMAFGGLGLLTASRAQKIESVNGLMNLVMMPMWIFSGVFFSYERFPAVIQPLIKVLPLTALNDALRASILEGTPLIHQWPRLLILFLWGGVSFLLALKLLRWTYERASETGSAGVFFDIPSRSLGLVRESPSASLGEVTNEAGCGACESTTLLTSSPAWRRLFSPSPSVVFAPRQFSCEHPYSRYDPFS
jgi:ABC-2 type transport system permease protein